MIRVSNPHHHNLLRRRRRRRLPLRSSSVTLVGYVNMLSSNNRFSFYLCRLYHATSLFQYGRQ